MTENENLLKAAAVADTLIEAVGETDVHKTTPCDEFDVLALADHLVLVVRRIRIVLGGGDFRDAVVTGAATYDEVRAAWREGYAALQEAAPGFDPTIMVTAPFGTVPAQAARGMYTGEFTIHSWDLARAIGRDDLLDPSLAEELVEPAKHAIPADREGIPFGPVVEVADDAPAYDRLLGWYGRDPHWAA